MTYVNTGDGARIHYEVFGPTNGEPMVLLMGLAVDRWGWIRQRSMLSTRFRCIAIDNRGAGLSSKPHGQYDLFTMSDDIVAVLDAERVESTHVMGYSLGGVLAQMLAVRFPDRVRSLVLASTACRLQAWRRELLTDWSELVEERGVRAFALENLRWVAAARHMRWVTPLAPALAPLLVRAPSHGVLGQIQAMIDIADLAEPVHDSLALVRVPALVIVGTQDILTPVADSEEIAHRIPHAEFSVVSGAAHSLVVTDAGPFNQAVAGFHDRVLGRPVGSAV